MDDYNLVLTFKFDSRVFVHAVLAIGSLKIAEVYSGDYSNNMNRPTPGALDNLALFSDFNIYIGASEDWRLNTACAGGPFLRRDSPESYDTVTYDGEARSFFKFGHEEFCNLPGQYVSIVQNVSRYKDDPTFNSQSIQICTVGIHGTSYERAGAVEPEYSFEIDPDLP